MILRADAARIPLRDGSVHMVVTSPPYWGLRSYPAPPLVWGGDAECPHEFLEFVRSGMSGGTESEKVKIKGAENYQAFDETMQAVCSLCGAWRGQLGLEPTPELYVEHLVDVFREVWRVLRDDGTLWLNLGDCYATGGGKVGAAPGGGEQGARWSGDIDRTRDEKRGYRGARLVNTNSGDVARPKFATNTIDPKARRGIGPMTQPNRMPLDGLKPKDLVGIPWRVAFALQADGWWLRSDIIWAKPNPMPESVTDRPTKAHEYLFLLAKAEHYYYDADAIREPHSSIPAGRVNDPEAWKISPASEREGRPGVMDSRGIANRPADYFGHVNGRNRRTVWEIATQPYPEAHFATFPEDLVVPCVLAGTSERGCCTACGAPWERMTERASLEHAAGRRILGAVAAGRAAGLPHDNPIVPSVTVGWEPTCTCPPAPLARPLVLDPFAGSGTVGEVCHRLGRRFVGLELAEAYVALAQRRTAQLGLL